MRQLLKSIWVGLFALSVTFTPSFAHSMGLIRDAEIERTLRRLTAPVIQASGLTPSLVNLFIINNRSLNAFVAGGRNIFFHTGLLIDLETPEELLGVVAHEAGHITGGHLARRSINLRNAQGPALVGLLLAIAAGAAGGGAAAGAIAAGSQSALVRGILKFSRAEEAAADQAALDYLARAKIDPDGFKKVIERFRGQEVFSAGNADPYIRTHPLSTQRTQLIERRVAASNHDNSGITDDDRYWHARMRAKLEGFLDSPERVLDRYADGPETELSLYAESVAWHRLPAPDEAIETIDRLLALKPNDPYYVELKGQILYESGRVDDAVIYYRKAVKLAPQETLLQAGLGRALLAQDTPDANKEALAVLKAARRFDGQDAAGLRDLAVAYNRAGDQGMAALATAERQALRGNLRDATLFAKRAAAQLAEGSPGWLRAQDILSLKGN